MGQWQSNSWDTFEWLPKCVVGSAVPNDFVVPPNIFFSRKTTDLPLYLLKGKVVLRK